METQLNQTQSPSFRPRALALLLACPAASVLAQSNVAVYGVLDSGIAYTTNTNAAGAGVTKIPTLTGSLPSRLGFRGTEDLGDGLQAIFTLETGLGVDTGNMGQNRLFGRQASVGLKGSYGQIALGRQVNMTFLATQKADVMGPNLFSISSIDLYLPNARSDNSIFYFGRFRNVSVGATYSLGRDSSAAGGPAGTNCAGEVAGNAKACRQVTGLLAYETEPYGVSASYDIMYGNAGAAGGLTSADNSDKRVTLNGYVKLGEARLGAGVIERSTRAATGLQQSDLYYCGISYPLQPLLTLDAQLARKDQKGSDADATLLVARLTYHLSKRTATYASLGRMQNSGASAIALDAGGTVGAGKTQNGLSLGLRHFF
ncbi:porin [Pseudoduganella sp. CY13W]|uniref:Porin n=1 Tax=Duganella qianjiadongensis TaxID=2692176 RepID=A0ABW9VH45_9BURK|nr:porin [Duganella qianjiadongensis]